MKRAGKEAPPWPEYPGRDDSPQFFRCHLCRDTGYQVTERLWLGKPVGYAAKCEAGNCNWWVHRRMQAQKDEVPF